MTQQLDLLALVAANFPDLTQLEALQEGGQKLVVGAIHPADGPVVLKIIKPGQELEATTREILAVGTINSPRVPKILQVGQVPTQFGPCVWFREQRIAGQPLRQRLQQQGPLTPQEVLTLAQQILEILVRAEDVQIVHRDVNPNNIMLAQVGDFFLIDFGLARHLTLASLTMSANRFGKFTPGYAPPEQFRNVKRDIDARADLFGLGVTLYEAATGANPFHQNVGDMLQVLRKVENEALPPLLLAIPKQQDFADFISCCTQKRRDHRPPTAREALDWINDICSP